MVLPRDLAHFGPFGEAEIWSHDLFPNLILESESYLLSYLLIRILENPISVMQVDMWVTGYVWYLELFREPRNVTQEMGYQHVGLRNGHCLGTILIFRLNPRTGGGLSQPRTGAAGGVDFNPRKISRTTQRIEKR